MIIVEWDNAERNVIRYSFIEPWTWAEYYATNAKRDALFAQVDKVVDIILDFTRVQRMPPDVITNFRKAASWDSPQRGAVVIVGVNAMLQALANIMVKVYPQAALKMPRPAKDLDHARQLIAEIQLKREPVTIGKR